MEGSQWLAAWLIAGSVVGGCTSSRGPEPADSLPTAAAAADEFVAAWASGDYELMVGSLAEATDSEWDATGLDRWMRRRLAAGLVTSFEIERSGEPSETNSAGVAIPITITLQSDAAVEPAEVAATLEMTYDDDSERWRALWDESLLFGDIDGARRFRVAARWPRRAPILDRRGRRIAVGPSGSRRYPFGSLAGSTIGHVEPLARGDLADVETMHRPQDLVGGSGIEEAFEDQLAGSPQTKLMVVDDDGRRLTTLGARRAIPGTSVKTTLDMDVQRAAEESYGGEVGGAVVMRPATGDLMAVVDSGAFDPGGYVGVGGIEPFNRALVGLYPPGSAMKVVTASAALDTGAVTPATRVTGPKEYKGVRNFESGEFGSIEFATALKFSVNTAFAQVAEDLGAARLTRYARAFGFNQEPALEVETAASSFPKPADEGDLLWGSIGQAQVLATPLQMATVAATVANSGVRVEPRITLGDKSDRARAIGRGTARTMTRLMENVVVGGTGSAARIAGARIAGKTGTAEVDVAGKRKNHAWFVCFAPADKPKVAIAVVSEYGGIGGEVAAPIAGRMLIRVLPLVR
ncbi:MAG: peptidoglycan D,D-transpeptidase FtsI family protein [Actinomycetota bacterium]